jgi:hypothetical protein
LGPSVARALALVFRVAWGVILAYFALLGVTLAAGLVFAIVGGALGLVLPGAVTAIVLVILGLALFIFVCIYVFAGFCLFLPGIVVERLSAYRAIKRGFALAQGGQLRILGVVALSWILIFVPVMAVYFVTGTTSMLLDPEALSSGVVSTGQVVVQQLLAVVASGFTTPFMVACILLLYYDQRVRREAFDLQAEADALAS